MNSNIVDTATYLIKAVVEDNDQITVVPEDIDGVTSLNISAPENLIGQIIGKDGKVIKSIRLILSLAHPGTRFSLNIKE